MTTPPTADCTRRALQRSTYTLAALLLRNILRAWRASKEINARRDAW